MSGSRGPSYRDALGATLRRRDPRALRLFLVHNAQRFGDERQARELEAKPQHELEGLMHRMILARPDLQDLHPASRAWLTQRGQDPFGEAQA